MKIKPFLMIHALISLLMFSCSSYSDTFNEVSPINYVLDKNYNGGCRKINPVEINKVANYHSLTPGMNKIDDVLTIMGKPDEITNYDSTTTWLYRDEIFHFENDVLTEIWVAPSDSKEETLMRIIQNIGCPNINLLIDQDEEPDGKYDVASFVYINVGVEYRFNIRESAIYLISRPSEIKYFIPISITEYFVQNPQIQLSPSSSFRLVDWSDLVTK